MERQRDGETDAEKEMERHRNVEIERQKDGYTKIER
jgi:hypothetical protein